MLCACGSACGDWLPFEPKGEALSQEWAGFPDKCVCVCSIRVRVFVGIPLARLEPERPRPFGLKQWPFGQ